MSKAEELLKIQTIEEWIRRREEFKGMEWTDEVFEHIDKLVGKAYAPDDVHMDLKRDNRDT